MYHAPPPNRLVGEGIFGVGLRRPGVAKIVRGKNKGGDYARGAFVTRSMIQGHTGHPPM